METPAQAETKQPQIDANTKAGILLAVSQLDMLVQAFGTAPERVKKAGIEFRNSLKEWAGV